jgi:hypothetical protein
VERLFKRFGKSWINFCAQQSGTSYNTLTLVSGSLLYIDSLVSTLLVDPTVITIGVLDHHFHGQLRNGRPSGVSLHHRPDWNMWMRDQHETVGGVTRFGALFCSSIELSPVLGPLKRTILNHVVDFGIRPQCVLNRDHRLTGALTLQDLLYPSYLDQPILYPTQFCGTGLGCRSLEASELANVLGFPAMLRIGGLTLDIFDAFLPSHLLHAVLASLNVNLLSGRCLEEPCSHRCG